MMHELLLLVLLSFSSHSGPPKPYSDPAAHLKKLKVIPVATPMTKAMSEVHKKTLQKNPKDIKTRIALAKNQLSTGEYFEARENLKIANENPNPESQMLLLIANEKTENFLEQIRLAELLRDQNKNSYFLTVEVAKAYLGAKKYDKTIEYLKEAQKIDAKNKEAYFMLIDVYDHLNNKFEMRNLLADMVERFPKDSVVFADLCRIYSNSSFIEDGIEICRKAVELRPSFADNHAHLSILYKNAKDIEQAEKIIFTAAKTFKKSELVQYTAASFAEAKKNYEMSAVYYQACVMADKKSFRCWVGLGKNSSLLDRHDRAINAFVKACQLRPKEREVFRESITALRLKDKNAEAEKYSQAYDKCASF